MINMIQNAKDQAAALAMAAYRAAAAEGALPQAEVKTAPVEIPPLPWRPPKSLAGVPGTLPRRCWTAWTWRVAISILPRSPALVF